MNFEEGEKHPATPLEREAAEPGVLFIPIIRLDKLRSQRDVLRSEALRSTFL